MHPTTRMTFAACALVLVIAFAFTSYRVSVIQAERAAAKQAEEQAFEAQQQREIDVCAKTGLVAVDIDRGHTPKCLDTLSGLMTVPHELYEARGGHL